MSDLTSKTFWSETAERAVKSAGQALVIALGGNALSALDLDWVGIGGAVAAAALLSVATSLASITVGPKGSPSLVPNAPVIPGDDHDSEPQ